VWRTARHRMARHATRATATATKKTPGQLVCIVSAAEDATASARCHHPTARDPDLYLSHEVVPELTYLLPERSSYSIAFPLHSMPLSLTTAAQLALTVQASCAEISVP